MFEISDFPENMKIQSYNHCKLIAEWTQTHLNFRTLKLQD